jgi:hypothetical protein
MSEKFDRVEGGSGMTPEETARLLARRRFTRAGLSVPVVLGTLASKPVLGQSGPPYNCTVSGQVSGNLSHPGDAVCSEQGSNATYWSSTSAWPDAMAPKGDVPSIDESVSEYSVKNNGKGKGKGKAKTDNKDSASTTTTAAAASYEKGTLFAGFGSALVFGGLASAFFTRIDDGGQARLVDAGSDSERASLYEVLALPASGEKFDLGRATVVSLCNYYNNPSRYPVTAQTIIMMFNATYNGGMYPVNSTVSWSRTQVLSYLTSLYS